MGRSPSPALRQELANLDQKDSVNRNSALEALRSYAKDLDTKAIPFFLAQVSETKDAGFSSGEYVISLFEDLARAHGPNIVPQIDTIMATIIKALTSGGGGSSFPLQLACSKVAPAIARYGIKPTMPEDKKRLIIHSLCKPLSNSLLGTQDESLSHGAAFCLKALVDCDNWRFASKEMVNEVCMKVAGALKDNNITDNISSHMGLVMSLANSSSSLVVEDYAGILIQSGLEILNAGAAEMNPQKCLAAVQMIDSLMKCLDIRSIFPELELVVEEMEKCQSDDTMPYVSGAILETLQTAKRLMLFEEGSKFEAADVVSESGSNFSRSGRPKSRGSSRFHPSVSGGGSPEESHTFADYESFISSNCQASCNRNVGSNQKNINRKLWNYQNGDLELSRRKDGLFLVSRSGGYSSDNGEGSDLPRIGYANGFTGFGAATTPSSREERKSRASTPQRSRSRVTTGGETTAMIYSNTPRRLPRSLNHQNDENSDDLYARQPRSLTSPRSVKCGCSPSKNCNPAGTLSNGVIPPVSDNENIENRGEHSQIEAESVSSTGEPVPMESDVIQASSSEPVCRGNKTELKKQEVQKMGFRAAVNLFFGIFFLLTAFFTLMMLFGAEDEGSYFHLVPT